MNPMRKIIHYIRFWAPVLAWATVIYLFSSKPTNPVGQIYWQDFVVKKTAHMIEYGVFTVLLYRALTNSGMARKKASIYAMAIAAFYAVTDETHQSFTPGRTPKARDVVIDIIGSGIATYTIWNLLPKAPKQLQNWARDFQLAYTKAK